MASPEEQRIIQKIADLKAQVRTLEDALTILRGEDTSGRARRRRQARTDRILEALAEAPDGMTRTELAAALGESGDEDLYSSSLAHLRRTGRARRSQEGRWSLPG